MGNKGCVFAENQRGRVGELLTIYIIRLYKMTSIWDAGLKYEYFDIYSYNYEKTEQKVLFRLIYCKCGFI